MQMQAADSTVALPPCAALADLGALEDRITRIVERLSEAQAAACSKLKNVLDLQTRNVTRALQTAAAHKDLRAAGPQVLALITAVHGASSSAALAPKVAGELEALLSDIRGMRAAICGTETGTGCAPTAHPAAIGAPPPPRTDLPHPEGSPWGLVTADELEKLLNGRHPRFDVYRVEEDRLAVLRSETEGPRWSLSLAMQAILKEHRRLRSCYGKTGGEGNCVPRMTVLTALRRIGAEPSDVLEHAAAVCASVERALMEDDFLCTLLVDAPLVATYPQWLLWRPMCHFTAGYLRDTLGLADIRARFAPVPPTFERPAESAVRTAHVTLACAVLHVMRQLRLKTGVKSLAFCNVALSTAEWVELHANFERWVADQPWAATDVVREALLGSDLKLRLYPASLRQLLIDCCWDRVRRSRSSHEWSLSFWERIGVTSCFYTQPSGRAPLSACGELRNTGCPFVGRQQRSPVLLACPSKPPSPDPRFSAEALARYRAESGDDLVVDPAFNAAGEGSEIDEEELVAGCTAPEDLGGFGPLTEEERKALAEAGERLARRLADVVHVALPTRRDDPTARFFFAGGNVNEKESGAKRARTS